MEREMLLYHKDYVMTVCVDSKLPNLKGKVRKIQFFLLALLIISLPGLIMEILISTINIIDH